MLKACVRLGSKHRRRDTWHLRLRLQGVSWAHWVGHARGRRRGREALRGLHLLLQLLGMHNLLPVLHLCHGLRAWVALHVLLCS